MLPRLGSSFLVLLAFWAFSTPVSSLNNVIVFLLDDLSPFYLDPHHPVKMPNLKNLASRGIEFSNAHTSFSVCGPSRLSILSGRYPDSTKLFTFERHIEQVPGLTSVAKYLVENHDYDTIGFGKVLHVDKNGPKDPFSRSFAQQGHWTKPFQYGGSADDECPANQWFCNIRNENQAGDFKLTQQVISFLKSQVAPPKPILAFIGLRKPHLELGVPTKFAKKAQFGVDVVQKSLPDSVDLNGTAIPFVKSLSRYGCYDEIKARRIASRGVLPLEKLPQSRVDQIRHYYFAASNWLDTLIGRIVSFVDSSEQFMNNTAFVVVSDHGFANGEHGMFCKNALFDQQTRVPFVVTPPRNMKMANMGRINHDPVGLVDVFPTVVHLATGVKLSRDAIVDTSGLKLDGSSVLVQSEAVYAFSQYPRCALVSGNKDWECVTSDRSDTCKRRANIFMGYMVRTREEKYVEWRHFQDHFLECARPSWEGLPSYLQSRMAPVRQIDPNQTGAIWTLPPPQRELFTDYQTPLVWSSWERENVLVTQREANLVLSLELSVAIRWRFDPEFANQTQPCSGNGMVRLLHPEQFKGFDLQPTREQVWCECLAGWKGKECEVRK